MTWTDRFLLVVLVLLFISVVTLALWPVDDGACRHHPRRRPWPTSCHCLYVYRVPRGRREQIDQVVFTNEGRRAVLITHDRRRRPRPSSGGWR